MNLTGIGSGGPSPTLSLSPTGGAFGNQVTGVSSAPKTVTVTNTNKGSAVSLNSLTASTGYLVTPSGASPCGGSLAAACEVHFLGNLHAPDYWPRQGLSRYRQHRCRHVL